MNEKYRFEFSAPLLRPGIKMIIKGCSKKYAPDVCKDVLDIIRIINEKENKNGKSE